MKRSHALLVAALSAVTLAGIPVMASSDASLTADANRANPAAANPVAYDMSATFGSNTVRMVLATTNGKSEYTTMLNGKVVASAVAAAGAPDQMDAYTAETAKVLTSAGANPAQFGIALMTPVSFAAQPEFDQAKFKKAMSGKIGDDMISKQLTGTLSD